MEERVRLKSTTRGKRSRGGRKEFGAGDAAGIVAGGLRRLFCVVLAIVLDCWCKWEKGEAVSEG